MHIECDVISEQWIGCIDELFEDSFVGVLVNYETDFEVRQSFYLDDVQAVDVSKLRIGAWFTWTVTVGRDGEPSAALNFNSETYTEEEIIEANRLSEDYQKNIIWD